VKVLLTGRDGQVGWELERALNAGNQVLACDRRSLDLSDPAKIIGAIRDYAPQVIVNAAAYTAVDRAESESETAMQVNGIAPGVMAEEARRLGALLVHYSTDYIFDGSKRSPYLEDDAPAPLNAYGRSKLEGERRVLASGARHLILRASWVYAPRGKNFFLTVVRKMKAGEPMRVVADQEGVPTTAAFIAKATLRLMDAGGAGIIHAAPAGTTSWQGFAAAIAARVTPQFRIEGISTAEYPTPARRPAYSVLGNGRMKRLLQSEPEHWETLLDDCIAAWKRQ
jgi:dTDP-4-dehydrorhamnose reductase